ncbi:MAG: IS1595 family transposase [Acidobacteriia bacterium]|nr:IS1595 family transposase [Terriglobia bacterium]
MKSNAKTYRQGIDLFEVMEMFPDETAARAWFESIVWASGRCCGHCGSVNTHETPKHKTMPYRCRDCRHYFSVKTGTPMACSNVPLRKWAIAIYLCITNLKSVSANKLRRDIRVSYQTSWFMMHRIREAWADESSDLFGGPAEVDESYFGGKRRNMSNAKRKELSDTGRGAVGKTAVVGAKDRATKRVRAKVVEQTDAETLQGFVTDTVEEGAKVYTDGSTAYEGLPNREAVQHSLSEYVRGEVHTNSIESFWSLLKRAHKGTYHKLSPKYLQRYLNEFVGRNNVRELGTLAQMRDTVARMVGRNLFFADLVADNGLSNAART